MNRYALYQVSTIGRYQLIAHITTGTLDDAYKITQDNWTNSASVEMKTLPTFARSSMCGDILENLSTHRCYVITTFGFTDLATITPLHPSEIVTTLKAAILAALFGEFAGVFHHA